MFETLEGSLEMIGIYAAVGFALAVIYNILRFFRLAFPKARKAAAVSDFLFAVFAGFVLFVYSVPYGTGFFRLYYVIAAAFGFAVNMVTIGLAVPPLARILGKVTVRLWHVFKAAAAVPVHFICDKSTYLAAKVKKIISKIAEKRETYLQNHRQLMYNKFNHRMEKVYPEGGENRHAIKAKVRKTF